MAYTKDIHSSLLEPDILHTPLQTLIEQQDEMVANENLVQRVYGSGFYSEKWKKRKGTMKDLQSRDELHQLPCIDGDDILKFLKTGRSIKKGLLAKPRNWLISRGTTGDKKWLPVTLQDIDRWFRRIRRLNGMYGAEGVEPEKLVWAINEPLPRVSNAIPYLWEQADYHYGDSNLEWIIVAMDMLPRNHWDQFVIKKGPQWFMSSVNDALDFAEHIQVEKQGDVTEFVNDLEKGFFWGDVLDGEGENRAAIEDHYGVDETFSIFVSAECREMYAECSAHDGLHLWMDDVIHEIQLSNGEILFVDQASAGMEGQYILTCFYEAFPLICYKTGDLIRVVSNNPCTCGFTHPRVKFLGRMDG